MTTSFTIVRESAVLFILLTYLVFGLSIAHLYLQLLSATCRGRSLVMFAAVRPLRLSTSSVSNYPTCTAASRPSLPGVRLRVGSEHLELKTAFSDHVPLYLTETQACQLFYE